MTAQSSSRPLVVVVGCGPAGLAAAIELGRHGVRVLLVERSARAGHAPRAKTTHTRTREHLRRWGIADRLAAASPFGVDFPSHITFVTRLGGHLIARLEHGLNCAPARDERYSEHSQWIPQYKLEAVLLEHARSLPTVEIEFGRELVGFDQDDDAVRLLIRDVELGTTRSVVADYLIGADGARSTVRAGVGARMVGTYGISRNYNTIFRAPGLMDAHPNGPAIMYWQVNDELPSLIGPMDEGDLWYFMPTGLPDGTTYTPDEAADAIRRSTGIDLPSEILSSDEWVASRLVADRYSCGRAFLVGDACHLHPPYGGYGMNMGVADSVDLGWKMAAVLQGWGGCALLDSYEIERRPVHGIVMDEAELNHAIPPNQLVRPGLEDDNPDGDRVRREIAEHVTATKRNEFEALGVVLGLRYEGSPVIVDDGRGADHHWSRDYVPSALPGCLAPHRWLDDDTSLYDLFGMGFTLLVMDGARSDDMARALFQAERTGTPLEILHVDDPALRGLYQAPLALIRPDQYVAWRGDRWPDDGLLDIVSGRVPAPPIKDAA
ncbi:FAD-dependent monooxygenase [uncultured Sphingomonas sp.]|uniref:FAD-dependent monooxygenase n=1 Tax=uncultured Sphingomonas sp. TaxID=158754 RepID=UPI0035C985A5